LKFSTLVVRRLEDGVCLQGTLETNPDGPDVESLAKQVSGVSSVINHLLFTGPLQRRPLQPR
jgi:osmotically-inducible protein OsmY